MSLVLPTTLVHSTTPGFPPTLSPCPTPGCKVENCWNWAVEPKKISFFPCKNLVWSCPNKNRREEVGSYLCASSHCCAESNSQLMTDALVVLCWDCSWGIHVSSVLFAFRIPPLPFVWGWSLLFSLRAANNSSAELWNEKRDKCCLSSEPARRFLCYWFVCMCQSSSSGLLSSPRSWSVSPLHLALLSLCINKSARLFSGM